MLNQNILQADSEAVSSLKFPILHIAGQKENKQKPNSLQVCTEIKPALLERCRSNLYASAKRRGLKVGNSEAWTSASMLLAKFTAWKYGARYGKMYPKPRVGLCFYGIAGSGKTVLAETLVLSLRGIGVKCIIQSSQKLTESYVGSGDALERYIRTDALIDDIGCERDGMRFGQTWGMGDYLKERYDVGFKKCGALTILTTNLSSPEEIAKRYGDTVMSRLREMVDFVLLPPIDWRLENSRSGCRW